MTGENEAFFRHLWISLKNSKPRMRRYMDQMEVEVEHASKFGDFKKSSKKEESPNDNPDPDEGFDPV